MKNFKSIQFYINKRFLLYNLDDEKILKYKKIKLKYLHQTTNNKYLFLKKIYKRYLSDIIIKH